MAMAMAILAYGYSRTELWLPVAAVHKLEKAQKI